MTAPLTETNPPQVCWNCHERTSGTHFCASCGKLLQMPQAGRQIIYGGVILAMLLIYGRSVARQR